MTEPLDLNRHAIFEASAGTGKTHAIGQIVLRLLGEGHCRLDNILLVTFTEKATGELKDRLRRGIEATIDAEPTKAVILQRELDQFDQASILTIHGFCLRLLQNYAGELGQDVQFDFANDDSLRRDALHEVERKDWPAIFGEKLPAALRAAGFDRDGSVNWERKILGIVNRYRPECGHRLIPDPSSLTDAADEASLKHHLAVATIERMRQRMREGKRQRGVISFDDVIERVAAGLDPALNPLAPQVAAAIREQYRFAIVDEFQDTDALQWSIFRRLFLEAGESRLIVVGDPKQAIYGFRGADLPTYRAAVEEMRTRWNAATIPLAINWRSSPELIAGLNRFFGDGAFFPADPLMTYAPVAAPPEDKQRTGLTHDVSGRAAITIVDVDGDDETRMPASRTAFARFTAREIRRLLTGDRGRPLLHVKTPHGSRPLTAKDICLLTVARNDAQDFTRALRSLSIPYSLYKTGGVRSTAEAGDIGRVLEAIAYPEKEARLVRALMTMFFRVTPGELLASGGVPASHPGRLLVQKWRQLAEDRKWSELFASMLKETGVLFFDGADVGYDRRLANLKLLLDRLQFAGYQRNLDLFELLDVHENASGGEAKEEDYQPRETDEPRVQVMTIHSAKGLEFPVVFHVARFGDEIFKGTKTYRDDAGRLAFDLPFLDGESPDADALGERVDRERLDELRRLYYVALTRPQFKLYLPSMATKAHAKKSPLVTLLMPALEKSELGLAGDEAKRIVPEENVGQAFQPEVATAEQSIEPTPEPLPIVSALPIFDSSIARRRTFMKSFTGMHREAKREQADAFGDRPDRRDEVHEPVVVASDPFRGPVFGEMVHEVFEQVDFAEVKAAASEADLQAGAIGQLIAEQTSRFLPRLTVRGPVAAVAAQCRRLLGGMVWKALRTPLRPLGGMLCEVPRRHCLVEMEFLYPRPQGTGEGSEFVAGFMDLVFRWKGAIYLLDWKTNVLPSYDSAGLEAAMDDAGYHLQYELYWEALNRWLERTPRRDGAGQMANGGVFYLFLRGLNGVDDSSGVYFVPGGKVEGRRHG